VSGTPIAEGITNPPIDELLTKTDSKYRLVLYAAKRARQINAYYSQLGEGLLEYVGPLVDTHVQEKPLSVALREINDDLLTYTEFDPEVEAAAADIADGTPASDFAVDFGISLADQGEEGAGPDGASAP
jgi:DNA-directed RNA polymerase subunit omega